MRGCMKNRVWNLDEIIEVEKQYTKGKLREAKTIETKRNRLTKEKCEFKVTTRYCKIQLLFQRGCFPSLSTGLWSSGELGRGKSEKAFSPLPLPFLAMFFHKQRACSQATVFQTQMKIRYFLSIYLSFSSVDHSTVKLLMAVFCLFCLNCLRARSSPCFLWPFVLSCCIKSSPQNLATNSVQIKCN